ncbi:hypothetical protein [Streptomyces sp. NPDC050504]|uniref:hypothetical protein n=1 Tax=Streptomyces sp. NPDC050504 TaxID=3365618 RepID=UPI0037920898
MGKIAVALLTALLALVGTTGAAGAASAPRDDGGRAFAAQAREAGLTAAQARSLQARVDGYLAKTGGRQVAINKIDLGGGTLLLTLPGEERGRDLSVPGSKTAAASCPWTYMCAWPGENFTGDGLMLFTCGVKTYIPWTGTGSWISNQRAALIAKFYDVNGNVGWTTPGGTSDAHAPWGWVYHLSPC